MWGEGEAGGSSRGGALRRVARRSSLARFAYARFRWGRRVARERLELVRLRCSRRRLPHAPAEPGVIVSLTSFPERIEHAWIPIETMFRQDRVPDRIVLVLSDDEFGSRSLPRSLRRQQRRGLEIVWMEHSARSFDKLVPTRCAHPDAAIITIDDDVIYERWVVSRLLECSAQRPQAVVGHRGWTIAFGDAGLAPYREWAPATTDTPAVQVFLTGVGGVLYPPRLLPTELLTDTELAIRLCPTADDVWFWAVAAHAGVPAHCLGLESFRPLRRQDDTPQLHTINREGGQNDVQLAHVIDHFGGLLPARDGNLRGSPEITPRSIP